MIISSVDVQHLIMYATFQDRHTETTHCQMCLTLAYTEQQSNKMMQHMTQNGFRLNIFVIFVTNVKFKKNK